MRTIALEHIPNLWRANDLTAAATQSISTGFIELDQVLGGGWPAPALLEVLLDQPGIGELRLLLPLMRTMTAQMSAANKPMLWINPPHEPHAIALAQHGLDPTRHWCLQNLQAMDALWAAEQALRSGACSLLLCWLQDLNMSNLRRLKLAAFAGGCVAVLFRASSAAVQPTPANLRLRLVATATGLCVAVLKFQGRRPNRVVLTLGNPSG